MTARLFGYGAPCMLGVLMVVLTSSCYGNPAQLTYQQEQNLDSELLHDVVVAIERATTFFAQDFASVNVDGLFGIRLCQGSLIDALKDCSSFVGGCPDALTSRIEAVVDILSQIAQSAMPYIQQQDPVYFAKFEKTIDQPYQVDYVPERLTHVIPKPKPMDDKSEYDEEKGDQCYADLLGTHSNTDRVYPPCTINEECWDYMTHSNTKDYVTTHQLLFLIVGEKTGCLKTLNKLFQQMNGSSVRDQQRKLCRDIYGEAIGEYNQGRVETLQQDLFLEQSLLCGVVGFVDFSRRDWIKMVLSWQTVNGCFSLPGELMTIQNRLNDLAGRQRHLLDMLYDEAAKIDEAQVGYAGSRKLLREQNMSGGCLAHKTGLAFGTLGTYVRQLLHQLYDH